MTDFSRHLLYVLLLKFKTSRRTEDRSTLLNNICHTKRFHINDLLIDESHVAALDSLYLYIVRQRLPHHCTNRSVHSRCISSACQYTYRLDFIRHHYTSYTLYHP